MGAAQETFKHMVRNELAPMLRDLGFRGTFKEFRLGEGNEDATFSFQGSRYNTKDEYQFCLNWWIEKRPRTKRPQRRQPSIHPRLVPEGELWWLLEPSRPSMPIALEVLSAIRDQLVPAMLMELRYPEEFPRVVLTPEQALKVRKQQEQERRRKDEWLKRRWGRPLYLGETRPIESKEELLQLCTSSEPFDREYGVTRIKHYLDDEAKEALLSLTNDPWYIVRQHVYRQLRSYDPTDPTVTAALVTGLRDDWYGNRREAMYSLMVLGREDLVSAHTVNRSSQLRES